MDFNMTSIIALILSVLAILLEIRRDFLIKPDIIYSVSEKQDYSTGVGIAVKRAELPGEIKLKYGVVVTTRSEGKKPANNVQIRVTADKGSYIVQVHTDDDKLTQRLPDLGRQGSPEVFITIPLMAPEEEVKLTFWYGIPDKPDIKPNPPQILVRHSEGLGKLKA